MAIWASVGERGHIGGWLLQPNYVLSKVRTGLPLLDIKKSGVNCNVQQFALLAQFQWLMSSNATEQVIVSLKIAT